MAANKASKDDQYVESLRQILKESSYTYIRLEQLSEDTSATVEADSEGKKPSFQVLEQQDGSFTVCFIPTGRNLNTHVAKRWTDSRKAVRNLLDVLATKHCNRDVHPDIKLKMGLTVLRVSYNPSTGHVRVCQCSECHLCRLISTTGSMMQLRFLMPFPTWQTPAAESHPIYCNQRSDQSPAHHGVCRGQATAAGMAGAGPSRHGTEADAAAGHTPATSPRPNTWQGMLRSRRGGARKHLF
jgi:hypothetical protein